MQNVVNMLVYLQGSFSFSWNREERSLKIRPSGTKKVQEAKVSVNASGKKAPGCGRTINWSNMASVSMPEEFRCALVVAYVSL
jgi:hypothetical protein